MMRMSKSTLWMYLIGAAVVGYIGGPKMLKLWDVPPTGGWV